MFRYASPVAMIFLAAAAFFLPAREPQQIPELTPRRVKFPVSETTLEKVLEQLQKQTGSAVADRRSNPSNPKLKLPSNPLSFWEALDEIGKQTGFGVSAYQADGGVALVDAKYRALRTHYHDVFRFTVKRITVSRDEETQAHFCQVGLDVGWEPRVHPLYLSVAHAEVVFAGQAGKEKLDRQTPRAVASAGASEFELRMPAADRKVPAIASLHGAIDLIAAPKMLEFSFNKLDQITNAQQEGVKLSLTKIKPAARRWTVDVLIEYPAGAITPLESYQSWMDNNRFWLEWTDPKTKTIHKTEPSGEAPLSATKATAVRYEFTAPEKTQLPEEVKDCVLMYRTPSRVVRFQVPFVFRDLPLP